MSASVPARIATWIIALLVGLVYGAAGTIAHGYTLSWFPLGLILAVIGCSALLLAVRLLTSDRWSTLATGVGMIVATLVFSGSGPGGSVVVQQTGLAITWTFAVPILVALAVAWPDRILSAADGSPMPGDPRTAAGSVGRN